MMSPWPPSDASDIDIRPLACENSDINGFRFQFNYILGEFIRIEPPELLRTHINFQSSMCDDHAHGTRLPLHAQCVHACWQYPQRKLVLTRAELRAIHHLAQCIHHINPL